MALSDYLSSDEWDACFYSCIIRHKEPNFGDSMHKTIDELLATGYKFEGLDEHGHKVQQISGTDNPSKLMIFLGNPEGCDPLEILSSGRNFLKDKCKKLVTETDVEWAEMIKEFKKDIDEATNTV